MKLKSVVVLLTKVSWKPFLSFLIVIPFLFLANDVPAWGFWAHKKINYVAVFTLPPPLFYFYKKHIGYIEEHAVDPDKRRYVLDHEAPRHYIDLDHYCTLPCDELPRYWYDAVDSFSQDTLMQYGIVPWHISLMMFRLRKAFEEGNEKSILKLSADIGHYIADAHVPLHTTKNYNGQLTDQKGIHGFWESRLPELFSEEYDFFVGKAEYIEKPLDFIWEFVLSSHAAVDSVLQIESDLNDEFPSDRKYSYEVRGQTMLRAYSKDYSELYHARLNRMVERRMRRSIIDVGSLWYTCWVNAGEPDMEHGTDSVFVSDSLINIAPLEIKGRLHPSEGFE